MHQELERHDREMLDDVLALVGIESPSGYEPGLLACYDLLRDRAESVLGSRGSVLVRDGVPHLLWEASGKPEVLLLGHADTVWPLGTIASRPADVVGDRATGPGIFDMKAGLVIALKALKLVADNSHVGLLVTGDEEVGSTTSRQLIEDVAQRYGSVLVLEPSAGGAVKSARKGVGIYQVEVAGRAAHVGLDPHSGVNALTELAALVLGVSELGSADGETSVIPTMARAGSATNVVPATATFDIDVRAWTNDELHRVDSALRDLRAHHPEVTLTVHGGVNRYPMESRISRELVDVVRTVASRLGQDAVDDVRVGGASDGNITAGLGVATLCGLGATGDGAHAESEWIDVASLRPRAELLAGVLEQLGTSPARAAARNGRM